MSNEIPWHPSFEQNARGVVTVRETGKHGATTDSTDKTPVADDPEFDGTDAAHPAWWRGEHDGAMGVIRAVNEWLDGKVAGTPVAIEMQRLKSRIVELRYAAIVAGARTCDAEVGVEEYGYKCRLWRGHKGPHRNGTTEWT